MQTQYETTGFFKTAEIDDYENGCQFEGGSSSEDNHTRFAADTMEGVIEKLRDFVGSDSLDDVLHDSCDEIGRVDIQIMETDEGITADKHDLAAWKAGEQRLWLACYTFNVEKVIRETVSTKPQHQPLI